jgi:hypothetical protein
MGDCGIAPEESWSDLDWEFFGNAQQSKIITFEKVFEIKSITKTTIINLGTDDKYYVFGKKFNSFIEAVRTSDAFILHTTYVLPVFVHVDIIELLAEEINKVLKSTLLLDDDKFWRNEWEVFLNRKSIYDTKKKQIQFIKPTSKPKCILPNHLGDKHKGLTKQLEQYLTFLFEGLYPYSLLNLSRKDRPEILQQHQIFSVLQLKYAHLLIAWTDKRGKIEHNQHAFWELDWVIKIETEERNNYFKNKDFGDPKKEYFLNNSKVGNGRFWERLEPLFNQSLLAYEEYITMKFNGIDEKEALYWSGLHNQKHKELAGFLIKNYTKN